MTGERMKEHNEMICSQIAQWLDDQLEMLDKESGVSTFFAIASRNLNNNDMKKLISATRAEAKRMKKRANGCPSRIWSWQEHFNG